MLYSTLVKFYMRLEATTKRLEMTDILAELFVAAEPDDLERLIYLTQGKIHPDWTGEPEIGMAEKMVVATIARASGLSKAKVESILSKIGDVGLAAEMILKDKRQVMFGQKSPSVFDVYNVFDQIAKESGKGSSSRKIGRLVKVMMSTSPLGARYLARTVVGTLRLGVGDMTILDALSLAFTGSSENRGQLERAYNLTSDLGAVARTLAEEGLESVSDAQIVLGKPIRMMLAQRLSTPEEILEKLENFSAEYKLDGERFQIHKDGDSVQIFSRRLENITLMYPDAVEMVSSHVKVEHAVLEGEAVAIDADSGEIKSFQTLMRRRRKHRIEEMAEKFPIAVFLFECLYVDGEDLTLEPYMRRREMLQDIVDETERFKLVRALQTSEISQFVDFFEEAISFGTEGLVVKSTSEDSIYRAGARSWLWVKLKASYQSKMVEPVDLVVVGSFRGRGRRAGRYGALLMASYDPEEDMFRTVCKVGSGFTDEDLSNFPELLDGDRVEEKPGNVDSMIDAEVWFRPTVVMELLGDEITLSPIHTSAFEQLRKESGLAIRFPRFLRLRDDKAPQDATTVDEIVDMYRAQLRTP
ncbi:MAG: ATP-dependent DNA ligase [Candidatus Bathyarchaeota archaeon]|jgi:DNA ligase-1|nr:ATP-dependent DNA ligase [Candidatus Bathyarchaeota archaeon]MDP7207176.1 ATP-dependent DNA ligase [Candidatus Bathyarchaeota archaeon]